MSDFQRNVSKHQRALISHELQRLFEENDTPSNEISREKPQEDLKSDHVQESIVFIYQVSSLFK